jgi:hypothetical protein
MEGQFIWKCWIYFLHYGYFYVKFENIVKSIYIINSLPV